MTTTTTGGRGSAPRSGDRAVEALRPDGFWNVHEVALYLGVPAQTIYQWRRRGYGPPVRRMGKHLRFHPADVVAWAESSPDTAA